MRNEARRTRWFLGLLFLVLPSTVLAQDITATVATDRADPKAPLRLSGSLRATLVFEGPAPLRVELPRPLLDPITDRDWKIQPLGTATVTPIGNGRERWSQTYRLDPYVVGESLPVVFAAAKVNGREISPGGFGVHVVTTVPGAKAENARPVTGIEELPPPPEASAVGVAPVWWAVGAGGLGLAVVLVWRCWPRQPPQSPAEWAATAFDRLERDGVSGAALVERAAAILRGFIDRRLGIPASKFTTGELLAAARRAERPVGEIDALRELLDRCDRAKFAGDVPDDDGCRDLLTRCRQWVGEVDTPDPGGGETPP